MLAGGKVGKGVVIEYSGDRVTNRSHYLLHGTVRLIRVRTFIAFLVGRLTDAPDRRQRPIQYAYDLPQCDFVRLFNKDVPTVHPTSAGDETGSFEREENLLQEFHGDMLTSRNVVTLERRVFMGQRELEQCPEAIFTFL